MKKNHRRGMAGFFFFLQSQIQTINTRLNLLQQKQLMRLYITADLLYRLNHNKPDLCIKCGIHVSSLFHCLLEPPITQEYWKEITATFSIVTKGNLPLCPILGIVGCFIVIFAYLKPIIKLPCHGKTVIRLNNQSWMEGLLHSLTMEKLTMQAKYSTFHKIWRRHFWKGGFVGVVVKLACFVLFEF